MPQQFTNATGWNRHVAPCSFRRSVPQPLPRRLAWCFEDSHVTGMAFFSLQLAQSQILA
jgi:hypothetical protein